MAAANPFQAAWNFLRMPEELASPSRSAGWVLPVPYESTTCYGAGTREGPAAILAASRQLEFYDVEFAAEPALEYGIHTLNALAPVHGAPDAMARVVRQTVAKISSPSSLPRPRVLCMLGGEHSISPGALRGLADATGTKGLVAVQIDAHGDMRDSYEGSTWSHACAARRMLEVCPVFAIGIRSLSAEEARFLRGRRDATTFFADDSRQGPRLTRELARFVKGKRVYLTIDLDGLDPSIMPSVGTPEPGGISWERLLEIVRVITREAASVPMFDVVELAPLPGLHGPDYLAATLVYKVMTLALRGGRGARPAGPSESPRHEKRGKRSR
jgi:agmatinase